MKTALVLLIALCLFAGVAFAGEEETPAKETKKIEKVVSKDSTEAEKPKAEVFDIPEDKWTITESGLKYVDLATGEGHAAQQGKQAKVHCTGWLYVDGKQDKKFWSSYDSNRPLTFKLGSGQMIKGFDEGTTGMKIGGERLLVIPSELAYGKAGRAPLVPPNSTLMFKIVLLEAAK